MLAAVPVAAETTVQRTIQDCNGDNLLEYTFGERHVPFGSSPFPPDGQCAHDQVREPRLPKKDSLINFLQLSDFQTVDEESPGRVEFVDGTQRAPGLQPFSAAYRPQESLSTQVVEAMVRQARDQVSPVTGAKLDLTILTGDNADSQQYNETRWFIDLLDGHKKVDPNSGVPTPGCPGTPGSRYDGVRDSGNAGPDDGYYEPDRSGDPSDGDGYSPEPARNDAEAQRDVTVRDFPGLLEAANSPFEAVGIGMPWYSAFGNHDALIQGNDPHAYVGPLGPSGETADHSFDAVVTGCVRSCSPRWRCRVRWTR